MFRPHGSFAMVAVGSLSPKYCLVCSALDGSFAMVAVGSLLPKYCLVCFALDGSFAMVKDLYSALVAAVAAAGDVTGASNPAAADIEMSIHKRKLR